MARIRTIKPEFWEDEKVSKVSLEALLLFIGMWNFADEFGDIQVNPMWIKSRVFPLREDVVRQDIANWLEELFKSGFLTSTAVHDDTEYYQLRSCFSGEVMFLDDAEENV